MSRKERKKQDEKNKKEDKNLKIYLFIICTIVLIVAAGLIIYFLVFNKNSDNEISYDELYNDIVQKKVEKIEMTVRGLFCYCKIQR